MEYGVYGEHLRVLTVEEERKFCEYVTALADKGFGIDRKRADYKLKMILRARGEVWGTVDGKYGSTLIE